MQNLMQGVKDAQLERAKEMLRSHRILNKG
jgi:hypothetical protein